jgi:hypothetical protein
MNGSEFSLKDYFKSYTNLLVDDGYQPAKEAVNPDNYWNLFFVDILDADGELTPLKEIKKQDLDGLAKILFPNHKPIHYEDTDGEKFPNIPGMSITSIQNEYNFSLMDYTIGVFSFLQREALAVGQEGRLYCQATNLVDGFWMAYMWMNDYRLINLADCPVRVQLLLGYGFKQMEELSKKFNNQSWKKIYDHSLMKNGIEEFCKNG